MAAFAFDVGEQPESQFYCWVFGLPGWEIAVLDLSKPITIVGGGLAGLTLRSGLRRRGIAVTVLEAGRYPRHRVCGEFISGAGQATLARLGLLESVLGAGAKSGATAAFFLP